MKLILLLISLMVANAAPFGVSDAVLHPRKTGEFGERKWSMDEIDSSEILKAAVAGALYELIEGRSKGGPRAIRSAGIKMLKGAGQNAYQEAGSQIIKKQKRKGWHEHRPNTNSESDMAYLERINPAFKNQQENKLKFINPDLITHRDTLSRSPLYSAKDRYMYNQQVNAFASGAIPRYETPMNRVFIKKK